MLNYLTDFRKTVETGVDPRLIPMTCKASENFRKSRLSDDMVLGSSGTPRLLLHPVYLIPGTTKLTAYTSICQINQLSPFAVLTKYKIHVS